MKQPKVLSFNAQKVKFKKGPGGIDLVEKVSIQKEFNNITKAIKYIQVNPIKLFLCKKKISLRPVQVVDWNNKTKLLQLELYKGINLEEEFKKSKFFKKQELINLIGDMFFEFKRTGFLWGDFAPRNMIYNKQKSEIGIFDFERETLFLNKPANDKEFSRYVRQYSMEEFACLLDSQEQKKLFSKLNLKKETGYLPTSKIKSKRKIALLKALFGQKDGYPLKEIVEAENIMRDVATPIKINKKIIFPMQQIEAILKNKGGAKFYPQLATALFKKINKERYEILKKFN